MLCLCGGTNTEVASRGRSRRVGTPAAKFTGLDVGASPHSAEPQAYDPPGVDGLQQRRSEQWEKVRRGQTLSPRFFLGRRGSVCLRCIGNQIHRRRANSPALAQIVRTQLPTPRSVKPIAVAANTTQASVPPIRSVGSQRRPPPTLRYPSAEATIYTTTTHNAVSLSANVRRQIREVTPQQPQAMEFSQMEKLRTDEIKKLVSRIWTATPPPRVGPRWPCTSGTGA